MLIKVAKGAFALGMILASAALLNGLHGQARPSGKASGPTQQQPERGRYLVEGPMHCYACHSPADWSKPAALPLPGRKGAGAYIPDDFMPFKVAAPNITPDPKYGIGSWSDAELLNAIRNGIGKDGRVLFPIMPYLFYRNISDEDLAAVIAYIRTQRPLATTSPKSEIPPPVRELLKAPPPANGPVRPDLSTPEKRGEYLAMAGNCAGCHTPVDFKTLQPMMSLAYSGGQPMHGPWGKIASANITPDASGISY